MQNNSQKKTDDFQSHLPFSIINQITYYITFETNSLKSYASLFFCRRFQLVFEHGPLSAHARV